MNSALGSRHARHRFAALAAIVAGTLGSGLVVSAAGATSVRSGATANAVTTLTTNVIAHWAPVVETVNARRAPSGHAGIIATVATVTGDETQNILLLLSSKRVGSQTWYDARLAILPNNSTGWVPASALGTIYTVDTHLYVDRETQTLTLKRSGVTIFTTRIGVGLPYWPTPAGQFYIRDKLTRFADPFYGPIAFGTSARSAVLTEWPGGGFIGVHGTNEPGLIPGAISHGCIRLPNADILRLAKLLPIGTPLTVT